MRFRVYKQLNTMDCGPACLKMISEYYGKVISIQSLREKCGINREGVSLLSISEAATQLGFRTLPLKLSFSELQLEKVLPAIVHWNQNHFVVLVKITNKLVHVADPGKGLVKYTHAEFLAHWSFLNGDGHTKGIVLLLDPGVKFFEEGDDGTNTSSSIRRVSIYFLKYKRLFLQLLIAVVLSTTLQLLLPFFTQAVIDVGVSTRDIQFVSALLIGQFMLFTGSAIVDFMRSWIMLHISARINISMLSDFLGKLIKLPVSYFDMRIMGDIIQRLGDHKRVEQFMTNSIVGTFFSIVNFIVLSIAVVYFNAILCAVYFAGSSLYFLWIFSLLKRRKDIDYRQFDLQTQNQNLLLQLLYGMQEIKLNDCEEKKRWQWERIQGRLFKLSVKSLTLTQVQHGGAAFLNQAKNLLVTFLSAKFVIEGRITLGEMMAVQFIIGQLNGPLIQFTQFVQSYQDAKISLERINEIHDMSDEVQVDQQYMYSLPADRSIMLKNVFFKYPGYDNDWTLKNINLNIPVGKTTAIVGTSGSGKTTLLKMLLKFYTANSGEIKVGNLQLDSIHPKSWRAACAAVLQDGYIFSDTIANNISLIEDNPDWPKLIYAVKMASIYEFISGLPLGFNTKIGAEGNGISQGQKQRILIARAIYKDPDFIFFDEATNSLDTKNERDIQRNLEDVFKGKTIIVVAHRLSTVRNADQIIVMKNGQIVEQGTQDELSSSKGDYFELVRNQLELNA